MRCKRKNEEKKGGKDYKMSSIGNFPVSMKPLAKLQFLIPKVNRTY